MLNKRTVKDFATITIGTAIVTAAVYFFMMPSNLAPGTAATVVMLIGTVVPLPISALTLIMNVALLIVGFLVIGPEFGAKTVFSAILMPAVMRVYELVFPNVVSITGDQFQDMVCYVMIVAVGLAMLFNANASSGGLDIIAKIMNKFLRMEMGKAMTTAGLVVCVSSYFFYDLKTVVISVIATYFTGIVVDYFIFGMNMKRKVCILSDKVDEITQYILHELHSGASLYEAKGAYNGTVRTEINVIVDKQEYTELMTYLQKTDPKAFVTVYSVNEVSYTPKNIK